MFSAWITSLRTPTHTDTCTSTHTQSLKSLWWPPRLSPPDHAKVCLLSVSPITFDRTLKEYSSTSLNFHYPAWLHSVAAYRLRTRGISIQSIIHLLNRYSSVCVCVCVCVHQRQPFKQPMVYSSTSTPGSCDWLETWLTEWAVASGSMAYMLENLPTWDWMAC